MHGTFEERRYLIPFRSSLLPQIFTDTLVIGTGVAGLRAAITAADHGEVIVLAKHRADDGSTAWAQGGIAAAVSDEDSVESHVRDTLDAGAGLCDEDAVRRVVRGARMDELERWGMRFDRTDGRVALGREGAHTHARILHADGDATGAELHRTLWARLRERAQSPTPAGGNARVFEGCFALDLITPSQSPGSPVLGAVTYHKRYGLQMIWAKATILATGGAGTVFRETTNPRACTGDGVAMAYRAGAGASDMAFVQFHPTALYLPGAPRALISEAVRGEGAFLLDQTHHRFMPAEHELAELAPRDVVSRAIAKRVAQTGGTHALLDVRHVEHFAQRFPSISTLLRGFDLDPSTDLIPVLPAAHYTIGGVETDLCGRTRAPGLYAVGECASTGMHGANRLASNSLLEGLVMGEIAGRCSAECMGVSPDVGCEPTGPVGSWGGGAFVPPPAPLSIVSDIRPSDHAELDLGDVKSSLRSAMWRNAGVERSGPRLADAVEMTRFWARYTLDKIFDDPEGWEVQNMLLVSHLIAQSAAWREESRGAHSRTDFTRTSDDFRVHDTWTRWEPHPESRAVEAGRTTDEAGAA